MLSWDRTRQALKEYRDYVISQSKRNLTREGMRNSSLYNKTRGIIELAQSRDARGRFQSGKQPQLTFTMPFYGKFVDQGVQGTKEGFTGKPFKFDKNKDMINIGAVEGFIKKKGIRSRAKNGRFAPKRSLVFAIARSIHSGGIKRSLFFTRPLQARYKKFLNKVNASAADDITLEFVSRLKIYFRDEYKS